MMEVYSELSELDLLELMRSGDELALKELYGRLRPTIFSYALRICKDADAADEVVQNVMLKVWQYREQIDGNQNFMGYLSKITANQAFDFLKQVAKQNQLKENVWQQMQRLPAFTEDQYALKEYLYLVEDAVKALPLQQQKIYRMSREEDLTYEEIARLLNISSHTVRNHMASALSNIRNHIKQNTSVVLPPALTIMLMYTNI